MVIEFHAAYETLDDPLGQFGTIVVGCDVCGHIQGYVLTATTRGEAEEMLKQEGWSFGRLTSCPRNRGPLMTKVPQDWTTWARLPRRADA